MASGGEFFSIAQSPYGYNETNALEFYPLTKEEAQLRGWKWRDELPYTTGQQTVEHSAIAASIHEVPDSIVDEILCCTTCNRNYRIVNQELKFYKDMGVPIPQKCPDCRNKRRLARRNPHVLYQRPCSKCNAQMYTTYSPNRPESVYCEQCYLAEVY